MENFEAKESEPKESKLEFIQLDPRMPVEQQPSYDFGIEITIPGVKNNLDHHGKEATSETPSACEQALELKDDQLPAIDAKLAILRADGDSITAAAVIKSRQEGRAINEKIVEAIGAIDRLGPVAEGKFESLRDITIAIMRQSADFKIPLKDRIEFVQKILENDSNLENKIKELVAARDKEFNDAKKESQVNVTDDGKIATVVSKHRFAMNLGYEKANIVVATNPDMAIMEKNSEGKMLPTGQTYVKHTIARLNQFVPVDINGAMLELNEKEKEKGGKPTWGGRGDIIGSPQNESSKLTTNEVLEIVQKYIK